MEHRMCVSCRFYQHTSSISLGRCGHPDHQYTGVTPFVRAGELRCRRGFERDDWSPAIAGDFPLGEDVLISERPAPLTSWRYLPISETELPATFHVND